MVEAGAAVMLQEPEFDDSDRLVAELAALLKDPGRLAVMSAAARTLAHPGAAERIAGRLASLARESQAGAGMPLGG
jgi:UDP-N-acetylglucosamine--N-acetylmuramyl-(pentapeptide) pyrophosphoryl-undecaprenol N-acetylglucosamine transferase